ncbi:MAG: 4-hydroxybenzoate octaprenyltransferase [Candidatus Thioglobus sp.]|jgi:4-hydroxybenzoate polyprenyltransferase and relat ed prenyltransferases|uniref:4-hydroxybenzoate octaprenyltransferase n=1 Tax=Candidatus Thioglobus sp. TaxID=2026721 RepID=UPI0001BD385C|nr:4-hydroxybenzoate octaprenyltransferase [Candidatus Thioglobus sp.]EEZ79866.1 MAG: 4-hydroxybenzoate polyprenyltransferase [uncultured Candidatus Thioglobus sp.]MBT3186751.1 4-hydroxybenzoate octaprenyltransferase [Candidatus Thioglobus sp.]MBT3431999.1 4-hydroxybenzoate octaprenyltransferase [Candidatus Thioglobus sp.]MBT3965029.1 4-hydroxybenzoate octaprenyltransferase [Candidatus Thioglobus sp.]MBT4315456.1 4-hydroxybenzoate octaprenyltransferase [Candidatus Thioglobus sp.]
MNAYLRLMRLDKPIGIYLLLWPTLWALFLAADGWPSIELLIIFILGVALMRSAGCVINDYADRNIDKLIERTKNRPITSGEVTTGNALKLFIGLVGLAFLLVLLTNWLTVQLAFVALFLAMLYPFTKRWTHLPQFVLGLAFAMSVPMAFAATNNNVPVSAWWIFLATIIWTVIYDTMYAMSDREEDLKIGVKSTAILFAKYDKWIIGVLQISLLLTLIKISEIFNLAVFYDISLILSAFLMIYHQVLIKNREKTACFQAFLHNNYLGMVIFAGIALSFTA